MPAASLNQEVNYVARWRMRSVTFLNIAQEVVNGVQKTNTNMMEHIAITENQPIVIMADVTHIYLNVT